MTDSKKSNWELFKEYCESELAIPSELLDLISISLELDYTAKGFSVEDIARIMDLTEEEVVKDLQENTGYSGLKQTLSVSPFRWYDPNAIQLTPYSLNLMYPELTEEETIELYRFLEKYYELKKGLDEYYGD